MVQHSAATLLHVLHLLETIKIIEDEKLLDNAKIEGEKIINQLTTEYKDSSKNKRNQRCWFNDRN